MTSANLFRVSSITALTLFIFLQWTGHTTEKDGGYIAYPSANGSVIFSHRSHGIHQAGYPCSDCHASSKTNVLSVRMDDIRQGKTCGFCHNGRTKGPRSPLPAFPVEECTSCHMPADDVSIQLNRMDPVAFSHIRHLMANPGNKSSNPVGYTCSDCHPAPFERVSGGPVGMEVPHESGGCAECHNGKERTDSIRPAFAANTRCLTCHKPIE
jgi:c(7)-type cytochrome triheme protein